LLMKKIALFIFLILSSVVWGGCAAKQAQDNSPIRVAMLPILDTIPIYYAQDTGLFAAEGVKVELIPVGSAAERDQVVAAKQADGMINDLVSVVLYNRQEIQVQVVRFMRVATKDVPLYRVLASPKSGFTKVSDLAGVPIGISQASIIDYVTDQLLQAEGLKSDEIKTIAVPKIPERMALLGSGELKAATLPEPFATMAIQQGGVVLVDDTSHPEYGNSVITFRKSFLDEHPLAVKGFLRAVEKAIAAINANPEVGRSLLSKNKLVPPDLSISYPMPSFPGSTNPTQTQFEKVAGWARTRGLVERFVPYADSVTSAFLVK
jgi:NitT/TauT family transport system substrate-binding protein